MVASATAELPEFGSVWRRKRDRIKVRVVGYQLWFVLVEREPNQRKTRGRDGKRRGARDNKQWPVKLASFRRYYELVA